MKKLSYLIILALVLGLVLTGCSLLSNIGQAPANNQSGITYLTKGGTEAVPQSFPLYAGQDWEVGEVLVWDDGIELCVKYQLFPEIFDPEEGDGWGITETHLAVATTLEGIPHTKTNNPIPGQFPYGNDELGGVASWPESGWFCISFDDLDVDCSDSLFIAAHAVIEKEECIPGDSGTDTYVSDDTTLVTAGNTGIVTPHAAVPTDAGSYYGANTWINQTISNIWAPGALWIWESNPVVNPIDGDIVLFEKTFNVTGTPTAGELKIAVDNGYAVWLNGKFVGKDNLFQFVGADDDYDTTLLGDLKQAYVDTTTWQTVGIFDLTPYLQTGPNTLKILGVNEYMYSDDVTVIPGGSSQPDGTALLNPGGMAFQFTVGWEVPEVCTTYSETAWGAVEQGLEQFAGANWATYFEYITVCPCENVPEVINGGFELPVVTAGAGWDIYPSGTNELGWTVEWVGTYEGAPAIANLELHKSGTVVNSDEGGQYAELDTDWYGPSNSLDGEQASVRIYQDLNTCPGVPYNLTYAWHPRDSGSMMEVYWNNALVASHVFVDSVGLWNEETIPVTQPGNSAKLEFIETGIANSLGMFLDDVSVDLIPQVRFQYLT